MSRRPRFRRRRDYGAAWGTMHHGGIIDVLPPPETGPWEPEWYWIGWRGPERVAGVTGSPTDAALALFHFLDPDADVEELEPRTRTAGEHPVEAVA